MSLNFAACAVAEGDGVSAEELVDEATGAIINGNGLLVNALSPNALSPNALSPNALSPNALSPNALSPNAMSAITDPGTRGALSRDLLRYIVSCALRPDQSFSFSWTDSAGTVHQEVYHGDLGFADWWVHHPLADDYQREWVTACLASRTNWYGASVMISARGTHLKTGSTEAERTTYSFREGAFWGNLFTSTPWVRACYSDGWTRAVEMGRECAVGHIEADPATGDPIARPCGAITLVGPCEYWCVVDPSNDAVPSNHFRSCGIGSYNNYNVLTTFVP
ncbi:hypothetical protein WMF31_12100 [Sorangium sp. So ce1036]|uniref:hypothetical protein n=1 Tax=Sorangium sp. So ce1036 TaxID=3133328 RepID=UPI003F063F27